MIDEGEVNWFRKLLCKMFGHRSICLGHGVFLNELNQPCAYTTHWGCERCKHTFSEGWDE